MSGGLMRYHLRENGFGNASLTWARLSRLLGDLCLELRVPAWTRFQWHGLVSIVSISLPPRLAARLRDGPFLPAG